MLDETPESPVTLNTNPDGSFSFSESVSAQAIVAIDAFQYVKLRENSVTSRMNAIRVGMNAIRAARVGDADKMVAIASSPALDYSPSQYVISNRRDGMAASLISFEDYIGDATCTYNARSSYLRCAVNPCGPCETCSDRTKEQHL